MPQPIARVEPVRDRYFGTTIVDQYRWMEEGRSQEFLTWLQAQAAYTRTYLDALPAHDALLKRVTELETATAEIGNLRLVAGRIFYEIREPQEAVHKLVMLPAPGAPQRILLDPNRFEDTVPMTIDWYHPSHDGHYVAYGLSQGGSENSTLHVLNVESGKDLDLAISRVPLGGINWLKDNRSFIYWRLPNLPADAPATDFYKDVRVYLHHLGDDLANDRPIFGRGVHPGIEMAREDIPFLSILATSEWLIGQVMHGDQLELTLYTAPTTALTEPATCPWTKVADVEDEVTGYAFTGTTIYLKTQKHAPCSQVIATSLTHPNLANASILVPESTAVIEDILVAGDYLLTHDREGGSEHIRRVNRHTGEITSVLLPFSGTIREWTSDPSTTQVLFTLESWQVSPRACCYDPTSDTVAETDLIPPVPMDMSNVEVQEVFAPAADGTLIPLSISYQRGLRRDGTHPALLKGYGSYGFSERALFSPARLAWYERGGIFAVAHIRGGGEYGEAWHKAGKGLNKHNTIDDFIACAEYLIEQGYTCSERLAGQGGSAGGIPAGGALVKRPELWGAMVMSAPVTNTLRLEFTENGPPGIPEFGSVTSENGFKGLVIADAYSKVKDGVRYPAVLLTTGSNDPRVAIWQPAKMAARLQAATASGKPVLLRVEFQGGHGFGTTRQQEVMLLADVFAFLVEQLGSS